MSVAESVTVVPIGKVRFVPDVSPSVRSVAIVGDFLLTMSFSPASPRRSSLYPTTARCYPASASRETHHPSPRRVPLTLTPAMALSLSLPLSR